MTTANWVDLVLIGLPEPTPGAVALLLDPHDVIPAQGVPGWEWHSVTSTWALRRLYEQQLRYRANDAPPVLIQLREPAIHRFDQLPCDLSRLPVATIDTTVPRSVLDALPLLPADLAADLKLHGRAGGDPAALIAQRLLGVALPAPDQSVELLLAVRAQGEGLKPAVRRLLASSLTSPLARDVLEPSSASGALGAAWQDWCEFGPASLFHADFQFCGPALLTLVDAGIVVVPDSLSAGLPAWLSSAAAAADPTPATQALLAANDQQTPVDFSGWASKAQWWAHVRWNCATGNVAKAVVDQAWSQWVTLDSAFLSWLREHYASELGRAFLPPRTVDKIAPFLAYQLRQRRRPQVLAVMDGMGVAQWNQLRAATGASEAEKYLVLAALPTITQVSRQAIFAGQQPEGFASTIRSPAEDRLWRAFWSSEGLASDQVAYLPSTERALPTIGPNVRAAALVLNVVDEAMHSARGFDDVGFRGLLRQFADSGYLQALIQQARDRGWDLWFTADHGNLSCRGLPTPVPQQGLRVRSRGKRVWTFPTQVLRDAANVPGIAWDPPGYPQVAGYTLFAEGRSCYERDAVLVSHGGLSLDEVFVPLVRVQT